MNNKSSCEALPFNDPSSLQPGKSNTWQSGKGCWHPKSFDKAVVVIIDALRYDFTVPFDETVEGEEGPHHYHNNIPVLYDTAVNHPENAFLLPFVADPPTTTLQRLKGLTTGTLPTFIDAGSNFAGMVIDEDNMVDHLRSLGKNLVQLGDDTWQSLFPDQFDPNLTRPFDSFNVWDLHTVDNGVTENLFPLLHPENASSWDVVFGHYLGVDHAGHRYGPNHASMAAKLRQMDELIRDLMAAIDENTLLVVMGDHGMDSKGDHGGESDDEVRAALWMYSKRGTFGRTDPANILPPKTAEERPVPQIDFVPTLSLLLGLPIPFNNLGAPIEEAFAGSRGGSPDVKNLVAVNRLTSAQIKRYQHEYAAARGDEEDKSIESLSLWDAAESEWQKFSKMSRPNTESLRSVNDLYRSYQRETLSVCRGLWTRFHVPSMVQGIAILFAAITLLAFYARGLRTDRTDIGSLLPNVGIGSGVGALVGTLLTFFGLVEMPILEISVLSTTMGSILGASFAIFGKPRNVSLPLPNSLWGWLAVLFTVSQSVGFASNSYTIWEDEIMLFFLSSFGVVAGVSSMRQKTSSDRILGVYHSILFVFLGRIASLSRLCRDEQMPFCRSTYYSSSASSTSAPWQLVIPFLLALLLPAVVRAFYVGSKSYETTASLWIGVAFRFGLFLTALFWTLNSADDHDWISLSKETLKSIRVFFAQAVLALALGAGTTAYFYSKPCIDISVSRGGSPISEIDGGDGNAVPSSSQQPGRTTVTILGYGNVYGTRFCFLVVNVCLAVILMQKPMGQGTMALFLWQIFSLLEILDTNALTLKNSAIGPVVLGLLGSFYYFKTGHQAVLSSIQWETAFIPLSTIKYPWSPLLVILNTFGAQILAAVAVPLTVLWKRPLEPSEPSSSPSSSSSSSSSSSPSTSPNNPTESMSEPTPPPKPRNATTKLLSDVVQAVTTHLLYLATINLATTIWAGHLRRHLMLYRIFSPRFMLGGAVLGVVDVVVMLFAVGGVRWTVTSVADVFGW